MVEWKEIGEIAKRNKGIPITAGQMSELDAPDGNIRVFAAGQTVANINESELPSNCAYKEPSIIVKSRGYVDFVFYDKPFTHKNEMWSYSFVNKQFGKYVYYFLTTKTEFFRKKAKANSVKLPQLCVADTDKFLIPIPSQSEQNKIVDILDTFTSSIENLKEQIAQRRKQYEYYRDQLFNLDGKEGMEMKNVAHFVKERIPANKLTAQNYTSVENLLKNKAGRKDAENVPSEGNWIKYQKGDVLIGNIRPYLKKIWFSDREGGTNGDVIIIRANDVLIPKFMFYCLASDSFFLYYNQALKDGKMPRGEKNRVLSYVIPFFVKEKQASIVSILDTFEASIQNLEAQLAQREKQYEYYRNKLLTFE